MNVSLHAVGRQTIDGVMAAAIGLNYPAPEYGLIMATGLDGSRHTLVVEPGYLSMLVEASQTGPLELDAEQTMIPLIREGWPADWTDITDTGAWQPWTGQ